MLKMSGDDASACEAPAASAHVVFAGAFDAGLRWPWRPGPCVAVGLATAEARAGPETGSGAGASAGAGAAAMRAPAPTGHDTTDATYLSGVSRAAAAAVARTAAAAGAGTGGELELALVDGDLEPEPNCIKSLFAGDGDPKFDDGDGDILNEALPSHDFEVPAEDVQPSLAPKRRSQATEEREVLTRYTRVVDIHSKAFQARQRSKKVRRSSKRGLEQGARKKHSGNHDSIINDVLLYLRRQGVSLQVAVFEDLFPYFTVREYKGKPKVANPFLANGQVLSRLLWYKLFRGIIKWLRDQLDGAEAEGPSVEDGRATEFDKILEELRRELREWPAGVAAGDSVRLLLAHLSDTLNQLAIIATKEPLRIPCDIVEGIIAAAAPTTATTSPVHCLQEMFCDLCGSLQGWRKCRPCYDKRGRISTPPTAAATPTSPPARKRARTSSAGPASS